MLLSGARGKVIYEKNWKQKSRDTVPLSYGDFNFFSITKALFKYSDLRQINGCAKSTGMQWRKVAFARICKCLRSLGIDSKESIPPVCVEWRAGMSNKVV